MKIHRRIIHLTINKSHYIFMSPGLYYQLYRIFASRLPISYHHGGRTAMKIRYILAKNFVAQCGKNVNFEKGSQFGSDFVIGDNSGVGINAQISRDVTIGRHVMMGPKVVMLTTAHRHDRLDVPMGRVEACLFRINSKFKQARMSD